MGDDETLAFNAKKLDTPLSRRFVSVRCGNQHTLALTDTGEVYSWGHGGYGQLGHGDTDPKGVPTLIEALAGLKVVQIECGGWHSVFLTDSGDVYTCGWNNSGQLGLSKEALADASARGIPTLLEFPSLEADQGEGDDGQDDEVIVQIAAGTRHTACLSRQGRYWAWGMNKFRQVSTTDARGEVPTPHLLLQGSPGDDRPEGEPASLWCGPWETWILQS